MKAALALVAVALFVCGCDPISARRRLKALTEADCQAIQSHIAKLCADYVAPNPGEPQILGGPFFRDQIPRGLAHLNPQSVRIKENSAEIFLYKTPAGEETIHVHREPSGMWIITTWSGGYPRLEIKTIWTSKKDPTKALEPMSGSVSSPAAQEPR